MDWPMVSKFQLSKENGMLDSLGKPYESFSGIIKRASKFVESSASPMPLAGSGKDVASWAFREAKGNGARMWSSLE